MITSRMSPHFLESHDLLKNSQVVPGNALVVDKAMPFTQLSSWTIISDGDVLYSRLCILSQGDLTAMDIHDYIYNYLLLIIVILLNYSSSHSSCSYNIYFKFVVHSLVVLSLKCDDQMDPTCCRICRRLSSFV